jgi:hypothetical protein
MQPVCLEHATNSYAEPVESSRQTYILFVYDFPFQDSLSSWSSTRMLFQFIISHISHRETNNGLKKI